MEYRLIQDSEVEEAAELAQRVYDQFIAQHELVEGREEFHRFASAVALRERHSAGCPSFVAKEDGRIVGMAHLRHGNHIAMLFVDGPRQRQHIGGSLVKLVEQYARSQEPSVQALTVNSTPNAVEAYRKLGFEPTGPEQVMKGIRFIPMEQRKGTEPQH